MSSKRAIAVFLAAFAIGLVHCSSSSSPSGPTAVEKFGPPVKHYPAGASCRSTRPPGVTCEADAGGSCACHSDADCIAGNNGRCTGTHPGVGAVCTYDDCSTSADCGTGNSCACGDFSSTSSNVCASSNCRVDTDCGANGYCSPSFAYCGGDYEGVYCHTATDECINDTDCGNGFCVFVTEQNKWVCKDLTCSG